LFLAEKMELNFHFYPVIEYNRLDRKREGNQKKEQKKYNGASLIVRETHIRNFVGVFFWEFFFPNILILLFYLITFMQKKN